MNTSPPNPRLPTKRRRIRGAKHSINIDLNSPPPAVDAALASSSSGTFRTPVNAEVIDVGSSSSSSNFFPSRRFRDPGWTPSVTFERVVLRAGPSSVIRSIDIDDSDDVQVAAHPEPRFVPQAPIVVSDDEEEEEIIPKPIVTQREAINLDLSLNLQWLGSKRRANTNPNSVPDPVTIPQSSSAPSKEPTFNCPVCMNSLTEPSSTICGHIFCKECITMSIKVQKKCPTCRRKLNASNFHRVYLPSAE